MIRAFFFVVAMAGVIRSADAAGPATAPAVTFESHIRPIFKTYCFQCHGEGEKLKGKLDLRLRRLIAAGGETGPAIVPGDPAKSFLLQQIQSGEMPKGEKKLSPRQVELIRQWIAAGAPTARPEPEKLEGGFYVTEEEKRFWSIQPIGRPGVPVVEGANRARARTPIDAFVAARFKNMGLSFSADADKRTLIRRATFDLLGLPPTVEEVELFIADTAPDAYERLIDRLLASPHYGERWGRHWLDVAGYADSDGYDDEDRARPWAFRYRDYVIRAFNADKPLDQFIQEQLAGDEIVGAGVGWGNNKNLSAEQIEKLSATLFLRMGPDGTAKAADQKTAKNAVITDTIKIVSNALLGLTVNCAQCHDHRYDPISQVDYYRLRAVFEPALDWKNWREPNQRMVSLYTDADRATAARIEAEAAKVTGEANKKAEELVAKQFEKELAKLPEVLRAKAKEARAIPDAKRSAEQKELFKQYPSLNVSKGSLELYDPAAAKEVTKIHEKAAAIRATKPVEEFVSICSEVPGEVRPTYLFARGQPDSPKQAVPPGDLSILGPARKIDIAEKEPGRVTSGRRLAFARRLTDGQHPLTARVLVNRVWMHHFGKGIAATPADLGHLGERPTHPELLDYLASDLMQNGWRLKRLHKQIMLSTVYRQSSIRTPRLDEVDPDNRWLARMNVRRLEAETLRDAVLSVSGKLNVKMFGAAVPVTDDDVGQVVVGQGKKDGDGVNRISSLGGEEFRRSVYIQVKRTRPLTVLETFDSPTMLPNCEARVSSTVATQSLMLMNNGFMSEHAEQFASRVRQGGGDVGRQVMMAWRMAYSAEPTEEQIKKGTAFVEAELARLKAQAAAAPKPPAGKPAPPPPDPAQQALSEFCHALISANQFLYVD